MGHRYIHAQKPTKQTVLPSYEKILDMNPESPEETVTETLRLVPVPEKIFERIAESLIIDDPVDWLTPTDTVVNKEGKPKPFPYKNMLPGRNPGALNDDRDERSRRS
jgi:hypothetical protein